MHLNPNHMSKEKKIIITIDKSNVTWSGLNWGKIQKKVRRIQHRIYKAKLKGETQRLHWLQKCLFNSSAAKLYAVRQVTTLNKGRNTAGIDKIVITSATAKLRLAQSLELNGHAWPIRRVWIPKPGKTEKRPLGIPVIHDRAKQALVKLALEPEWEAVFEPNSYGFRPGRRTADAIEAIFLNLHHGTPKWVYDADIRKCFDQINQDALLKKLNTFPAMERQISAWLKAGVMEGYASDSKEAQVYPVTMGTPQGGVISPLLANIALHGLESHLLNYVSNLPIKPHEGANRGKTAKRKALGVVRYADDFVLLHRNKEILELCIDETKKWLSTMGLEINEDKSMIRDCRNGFLFLGFQIILVKRPKADTYKVKIQPSHKSQDKLLDKVRNVVQNNKAASSYELISRLRPIIIGWANYFKYSECSDIFKKLTHKIFQKVRAWVFRRDTRNGRIFVKEKYFPTGRSYSFYGKQHLDNWILVGRKKEKGGVIRENYLPHIHWVPSMKHVKVLNTETPYSATMYWAMRSEKYSPYPLRVRTLLAKQNQTCPICKRKFTESDSTSWEIDHKIPRSKGGRDEYKNLQLLHRVCHLEKTRMEASGNATRRKSTVFIKIAGAG
jgi:RNA-directed DNA polymerase